MVRVLEEGPPSETAVQSNMDQPESIIVTVILLCCAAVAAAAAGIVVPLVHG